MPNRRADDTAYVLGTNLNATGQPVAVKGGAYTVFFDGTPSGATVRLEAQSPSGVWMVVEVFTSAAISYTVLPRSQTGISLPACNVRVGINGGSPTGINCHLIGLG